MSRRHLATLPVRHLFIALVLTTLPLTLTLAQGELVLVGDYEPYVGLADVHAMIELPFPRVLGGEAPFTFELTAGALPRPFATRPVGDGPSALHPGGTYVILLSSDGVLRGTTGWPGRFTGTVTVTDANGRTGQADFDLTLALGLTYVGDPEVQVPVEPAVVVHGDRVRVSGLPVPALPEFGMELFFDLTLNGSASHGAPTRAPEQDDFDIHREHGTVSKMRPTPASGAMRWTYQVVAHRAERPSQKATSATSIPKSRPSSATLVMPVRET